MSHRNVALSFCPFILASSLMQCYSIVNNFSGGNTMIDKKLIPVKGLKKNPFQVLILECAIIFVLTIQKKTFSYLYIRSHGHLKRHQTNKKHRIHFPMTEDGMDAAISWLLEQYDARRDFWNSVSKNTMHLVNQTS